MCQRLKNRQKKYGLLPEKEAEIMPWEQLWIDTVGTYEIKRKNKKTFTLKVITMMDPATGWFEIAAITDGKAITAASAAETNWLSRHAPATECNHLW